MDDIKRIKINKNRGWRGLAELVAEDDKRNEVLKMIFSFSQAMWNDMLKGYIVVQDEDNYIVLQFDNLMRLPKPTQQRSVLIKHFSSSVVNSWIYSKKHWIREARFTHQELIDHFIKNKNNHTTSDWNCIGIRVTPTI